jgi:hypothetical protein
MKTQKYTVIETATTFVSIPKIHSCLDDYTLASVLENKGYSVVDYHESSIPSAKVMECTEELRAIVKDYRRENCTLKRASRNSDFI